ncbi:DUF1643 domain-containing protein [Bacillus ndiopicus]|uniref:DUF1643 domain-containing protein n=1 Tax=Bacillus ndiopicus TaxID=1347368 RepID=UPI002282EB87|nr:DUF1643 domain-containing protein [Bacillus ndiopicus]
MSNYDKLAWGTKGILFNRDKDVIQLIEQSSIQFYALELTKGGHPQHPLYVKSNKAPEIYKINKEE